MCHSVMQAGGALASLVYNYGHFITSLGEGNYLTSIPSPIGQNMVFLSCMEGRRIKRLAGQVF